MSLGGPSSLHELSRRNFGLMGQSGFPLVPALDLVMNNARNHNAGRNNGDAVDPIGLFGQRNAAPPLNNGFGDPSFEKLALLRPQLGLPLFGMSSLKVYNTFLIMATL